MKILECVPVDRGMLMRNLAALAGLALFALLGLGTSAGDAPNAFMSALYSEADPDARGEAPAESFALPDLGMELVRVPPGSYRMGSPASEAGRREDEALHEVRLTRGFWIGRHEVTVGDFMAFVAATGHRPQSELANALRNSVTDERIFGKHWRNAFGDDPHMPVVGVTRHDAQAFCRWLTARERKAGRLPAGHVFSLPTEAQWECACRAGGPAAFCFGDDSSALHRYGNFADRSSGLEKRDPGQDDGHPEAAPCGLYQPNAWGIYDMHGNVGELCTDTYWHAYQEGETTDPLGPAGLLPNDVLIRGGGWSSPPADLRSAARRTVPAMDAYADVGFRVLLRPHHAAVLFSLTEPYTDWTLIRRGDQCRIHHRQLPPAQTTRLIRFPAKGDLGLLKARMQGPRDPWVDLPAAASGSLEVPEGIEIKLAVGDVDRKSFEYLAPLEDLGPEDLQAISFADKKLSSGALRHLAHLTGLREVEIHGRRMRDSGLGHLAGLHRLERLDLSGTKIRGPGLDLLGSPLRVHTLILSGTKMDNHGLRHLQGLRGLRTLRLDQTAVGGQVSGHGPSPLAGLSLLSALRDLDLSYTRVTGSDLAAIGELKDLEYLHLAGTPVTGRGLQPLSGLTRLKGLYLEETAVDDEGLAFLKGLLRLEELSLGPPAGEEGPCLTNGGLGHLSGLKELRVLSLKRAGLSGGGLSALAPLGRLTRLTLAECGLGDEDLPPVADLKDLEVLDLSFNEVTDAGLAALLGLPRLKTLLAAGTRVTEEGARHFMTARPDVRVSLETLDREESPP